jgi:hypothetical protein
VKLSTEFPHHSSHRRWLETSAADGLTANPIAGRLDVGGPENGRRFTTLRRGIQAPLATGRRFAGDQPGAAGDGFTCRIGRRRSHRLGKRSGWTRRLGRRLDDNLQPHLRAGRGDRDVPGRGFDQAVCDCVRDWHSGRYRVPNWRSPPRSLCSGLVGVQQQDPGTRACVRLTTTSHCSSTSSCTPSSEPPRQFLRWLSTEEEI